MLIYHQTCDDTSDRIYWMADVIDPSRAAYLCTYKGLNRYGKTWVHRVAFVFDEDRKLADMADFLDEFAEQYRGRLTAIRPIRPRETLTVGLMLDYRPNHLPVIKEAI